MTIASTHLNELTTFVVYNDAATPTGFDISHQVSAVTLSMEADVLEKTTLGNTWKRNGRGLKGGTIEIEFYIDFDAAASGMNTMFNDFWSTQEYVNFEVEDGSGVGYAGRFVMHAWTPFSGAVGEYNKTTLSFELDGPVTTL